MLSWHPNSGRDLSNRGPQVSLYCNLNSTTESEGREVLYHAILRPFLSLHSRLVDA